jgi:hypothetical protein
MSAAPGGASGLARTRYVRRSCAFSSRTSSTAHSRASAIFPASRKARAWLSADRSAADSLPAWAPRRYECRMTCYALAVVPYFSPQQISTSSREPPAAEANMDHRRRPPSRDDAPSPERRKKSRPGPPMTLGNAAAARVRLQGVRSPGRARPCRRRRAGRRRTSMRNWLSANCQSWVVEGSVRHLSCGGVQ